MAFLLLAVFVAVVLFTATALALFLLVGEQSPFKSRLTELIALPLNEERTPLTYQLRDAVLLLLKPLEPFRDWLRSSDQNLAERLSVAGYRHPEDVDTYLTCKLLCPALGILLATFVGRSNILFFGLLFLAAGFYAPDFFLTYVTGRRKNKLNLALPDAVDLLMICIEAGLGLDQAVLRVAEEMRPVCPELSEELFIIGREQRAGKPRLDAWRSMADRVDLDSVRQFVAMVVQTEKLGTPIARALGTFADTMRTTRLMRAEENAAKTTIKLVFPLVLFIFPAIFIVLLGPSVIILFQSLGGNAR